MIFADVCAFADWVRYSSAENIFEFSIYAEAMHAYPLLFSVVAFWFGCNIGSFLNVCMYRIPLGMSLISPPSHCPNCNHKITWLENIPVFSYLLLGRKCSSCKKPISPRYMIGEVLTGFAFAVSFFYIVKVSLPLTTFLIYTILISVLIPASFIDAKYRFIPNKLTYSLLLLAPLYHLLHGICLPPHLFDLKMFYLSSLTAILFGGLLTFFAWLAKLLFQRDAFGLGDVKLIAGISAALGALPAMYIMLIGSLSAIIIVPIYRIKHPRRRHRSFPFGPFLAFATAIWLFFGIHAVNHLFFTNPNNNIEAICFINPRNYAYEEQRLYELQKRKDILKASTVARKRAISQKNDYKETNI